MSDALDPLILDLVEWVAREPRTYTQVMDAWRTSCPRLTVWEDAVERGYLVRAAGATGQGTIIDVTERGYSFLQAGRPAAGANSSLRA